MRAITCVGEGGCAIGGEDEGICVFDGWRGKRSGGWCGVGKEGRGVAELIK